MDEAEVREFNKNVRYLKSQKSNASMGKILSVFGKAFPKKLRMPDSVVKNRKLYVPKGIRLLIVTLLILTSVLSVARPAHAIIDPTSISIVSIRVFQNIFETGDQLFVVDYNIAYLAPPSEDPQDTYLVVLMDTGPNVVIAARPIDSYERYFTSIYLTQAQAVTWGDTSLKILVSGNTTYFPTLTIDVNFATMNLSTGLWVTGTQAESRAYLYTWCKSLALAVSAAQVPPVTWIGTDGKLNAAGELVFNTEITGLSGAIPSLFATAAGIYPTPVPVTNTHVYEDALIARMGSRLDSTLDGLGTLTGVPSSMIGGIGLALLFFILAGGIFAATGSVPISIVCGLPFILAGNMIGVLPLSITFVAGAIVIVLFAVTWILGHMG